MDVTLIISIIMVSGLVIERILKHVKKSKCLGGEIEYNDSSVPDMSILQESFANTYHK
jgi:hypothetical protein